MALSLIRFLELNKKDLEKKLEKNYLEDVMDLKNALENKMLNQESFRHLKEPCEECKKSNVYCAYLDLGVVDYYDNYWHICLDCFKVNHQEQKEIYGQESKNSIPICPFCNYNWVKGESEK